MISLDSITKKYVDQTVVDDVSIEIPQGKITSLIGANGAGKSTLLSIISRLLKQNNGNVMINERNLDSYKSRALAKELSILKQSNHLELKLTVRELIGFGRFPYSQGKLTTEDKLKIDEAIDFLDLSDLQDKYIDELSGGQKQRAFLALVVAQDTDYILLDEPLNNLDMKHSVQIMKRLEQLCKEKGKTIIIVIHEINFASHYSDYIVAMKNGKIMHSGPTEDIMKPEILSEVFDIGFDIIHKSGKQLCNYFY